MYLSSSLSSAENSRNRVDDDNDDNALFFSAWVHWLECWVRWRRFYFSKEKLNRNTEKSLGKTWNSYCAQWVQQTLEKKISQKNMWVFRRLQNVAEEFASLTVCGRTFQSLGAGLQKALKPNCLFFVCFSVALGISSRAWDDERRDRAGIRRGMNSCKYSGAVPSYRYRLHYDVACIYRCAFHTICQLFLSEGPDPICFSRMTK